MIQPISIYQSPDGHINLDVQVEKETIWLDEDQIAYLFDKERSVINKHINNIYKSDELDEKATCAKIAQVQKEGKRKVTRKIKNYNLDMVISIGYRVDSIRATHFRQRATQTLRSHIVDGYTFNPQRIQEKYGQNTRNDIQKLQKTFQNTNLGIEDILAVTKAFDMTRTSLDAYDKASLPTEGYTQETLAIEVEKLYQDVEVFKSFLMEKNQATDLFAQEKTQGNLEGIFAGVFQSVFGEDAYPTIEEKSANLLYFIVKNHPFNDGNKRTGAFAFIRFLTKANYPFQSKITPEALTTLTLLIAQSPANDKKNMIGLIILLLK